jgi:simple sugar transport system permease protein
MGAVKNAYEAVGMTRLIITSFLFSLIIMAYILGIDINRLFSDCLVRIGMNGLFVLSMLIPIVCGTGINFAMPIGAICGLLGGVVSLEYDLQGWTGLFTAMAVSLPFALISGYLYGLLLNKVRGSEMIVGNYTAFAVVAIMCLGWIFLPVYNRKIVWPMLGYGVRTTVTLDGSYDKILDRFLSFQIVSDLVIPTGLFLMFAACCYMTHLFLKTKTGMSMQACGSNPKFAISMGININKMRILATIISTVTSAIGMVVYSQSFGFYQFYNAPRNMTIPAIASILIGGASIQKATVSNVVIGTILFQSILTIAMPVANYAVTTGSLSEVVRVMVCNGIILYALTKVEVGK